MIFKINSHQTVEAEITTVYARYRESGTAESRTEMQTVKWTAEGMVKGVLCADYSMT